MLITRLASIHNMRTFGKSISILRRWYSQKTINILEPAVQKYFDYLLLENEHLLLKEEKNSTEIRRLREIKSVVSLLSQRMYLQKSIATLKVSQNNEEDVELKQMMAEEYEIYRQRSKEVEIQLQSMLLDPFLSNSGILLEIVAAEGSDATLFAKELFDMYKSYSKFKNWVVHVASLEEGDNGYKRASILIEGVGALELMNLEKGVHHRISDKDQVNRISTVIVSVLIQPSKSEMDVPHSELSVETQAAENNDDANSQSFVSVTHTPTGTLVTCKANKSNKINKHIAIRELNVLLFNKQKSPNEDLKKHTGLIHSDEIIRTYDCIRDRVMEHRENKSQIRLKTFLEGGELLEHLHDSLLNQQHYQTLMNNISKFDKELKSGSINENTP